MCVGPHRSPVKGLLSGARNIKRGLSCSREWRILCRFLVDRAPDSIAIGSASGTGLIKIVGAPQNVSFSFSFSLFLSPRNPFSAVALCPPYSLPFSSFAASVTSSFFFLHLPLLFSSWLRGTTVAAQRLAQPRLAT